jgi:DNA-binding response OmpR family regulator
MGTTARNLASVDRRPGASALVVEPSATDALAFVSVLARWGFDVTVAGTFGRARERLGTSIPDVLTTAVRLAEYNGLHLVMRARSTRPDVAALVVADRLDTGLESDAMALGATFVLKPIADAELTAAVIRTLAAQRVPDRPVEIIQPPFERRRSERRGSSMPVLMERRAGDRRRGVAAVLGFPYGGRPAS